MVFTGNLNMFHFLEQSSYTELKAEADSEDNDIRYVVSKWVNFYMAWILL